MEELQLEINYGQVPETARTETAENSADIMGGTQIESKLDEILTKVSEVESNVAELAGILEGELNGKTGNE